MNKKDEFEKFTEENLNEIIRIAEENTKRDKNGNIIFDKEDWEWEE